MTIGGIGPVMMKQHYSIPAAMFKKTLRGSVSRYFLLQGMMGESAVDEFGQGQLDWACNSCCWKPGDRYVECKIVLVHYNLHDFLRQMLQGGSSA